MPLATVGFAAQLTTTLQSGDRITPFYGANSFKEALSAAVDGDIITLSTGVFNATEVSKGVTIIGAYAFSTDVSKITKINSLTVSANNVTLEGIRLGTLTIKGTENLKIDRCYMELIKDDITHNNTIVTDCLIEVYNAMSLSKNTVIRNCCINYFSDINTTTNIALIENCNIPLFAYCNNSSSSLYSRPYAIYRNCVLGFYSGNHYLSSIKDSYQPSINFSSPSEFHNNKFAYSYYLPYGNTYLKSWNINWGSCTKSNNASFDQYTIKSVSDVYRLNSFSSDGIQGPQNHKDYPAIPVISSSSIDTKTDANGVLHVKITAIARD